MSREGCTFCVSPVIMILGAIGCSNGFQPDLYIGRGSFIIKELGAVRTTARNGSQPET